MITPIDLPDLSYLRKAPRDLICDVSVNMGYARFLRDYAYEFFRGGWTSHGVNGSYRDTPHPLDYGLTRMNAHAWALLNKQHDVAELFHMRDMSKSDLQRLAWHLLIEEFKEYGAPNLTKTTF